MPISTVATTGTSATSASRACASRATTPPARWEIQPYLAESAPAPPPPGEPLADRPALREAHALVTGRAQVVRAVSAALAARLAKEAPLTAVASAPFATRTPILAGTLVTDTVARVNLPGGAEQVLRVAPPAGSAKGDTVHLRVKIEPRLTVAEIGQPGALGDLTSFDEPPAQVATPTATAAPTPGDLPAGLRMIDSPRNFHMTPELEQYFTALDKISIAGRPVRGRLIGPPATGKTTAIYRAAADLCRPMLKVSMPSITSPEQLIGRWELTPDGTVFRESALVRALQYPRTIVFMEEINRTHSSNVNVLMELLDAIGEIWVDEVRAYVKVDPSVMIFGAMNVGAQFTGTFDMDAALESRFEYPIELSYLPELEEAKVLVLKTGVEPPIAAGMVEIANDTRRMAQLESGDALDKAISTRTLLGACDLVAIGGMAPADALKRTVLPLYSTEGGAGSQREKVAKLVQGRFGAAGRKK